jgi:NADH:ubiquinone oxidoreductase subunit F (NADH-binding)
MLGSGAVIVMDETTCMVKALERLSFFYYEESCGQCTPCREGTAGCTRWCIASSTAGPAGRPRSAEQCHHNIMGRTICALGDARLAGAELHQAFRTNSSTTSNTRSASSRCQWAGSAQGSGFQHGNGYKVATC